MPMVIKKVIKVEGITSETISKSYMATNIESEVHACEIRIADTRAKIRDLQMSIEYELGILSAYDHTKFLLAD